MQAQSTNTAADISGTEEYVTIVAPTISEVMEQFRSSDLAAQGFCITGRVGRHKFAYAGERQPSELFDGAKMVAATFMRTLIQEQPAG